MIGGMEYECDTMDIPSYPDANIFEYIHHRSDANIPSRAKLCACIPNTRDKWIQNSNSYTRLLIVYSGFWLDGGCDSNRRVLTCDDLCKVLPTGMPDGSHRCRVTACWKSNTISAQNGNHVDAKNMLSVTWGMFGNDVRQWAKTRWYNKTLSSGHNNIMMMYSEYSMHSLQSRESVPMNNSQDIIKSDEMQFHSENRQVSQGFSTSRSRAIQWNDNQQPRAASKQQ